MLFSKSILAASLGLISAVSSQVVVTVTDTVTVVTITVAPKSTSTYTSYTTVTGYPPPQRTTSYYTVTITSSAASGPTRESCPIQEWGQCGGQGYFGSCGTCGDNAVCKYKDVWYSYCSNLPVVKKVVATVYHSA